MGQSRVRYQPNTRAVRALLHLRAEQLVDDTGKQLVEETKARAPRSTISDPDHLHLADSYAWEMVDDTSGEMTTDVEYAIYQEYGTVFQSGTPHVGPAVLAVEPAFTAGVGRLLE